MKQAIKKKTFTKPSIKDLKESMGFGPKVQKEPIKMSELKMSSAEKETEFIVLPKAFEDALKNGTNTTGRSFVGTGKGIVLR